MKYKDLEKEGWIKFEDKTILEKEVENDKLCKLIYHAYKNNVKYNKGNVNEKLKEWFNNIKYINKKINKVTKLSFIKNIMSYGNTIDVLILDVNQVPYIILDITNGIDMSNNDNLQITKTNNTKEKVLYTCNDSDEENIDICNIKSVTLHKNVDIYNKLTDEEIDSSDYIEFKDLNNNTFYIDILFNIIYKRNNIYIKNNNKSKELLLLFKENIKLNYTNKIFTNKKFNIMKLFFNFEE